MNILISGGSGLIGRALTRSLLNDGEKIWVLTRNPKKYNEHPTDIVAVGWDGRTTHEWGDIVNKMDAIINLAGENTAHWPWNEARKKTFWSSRLWAGEALSNAVRLAKRKPSVLIQASGIGHYGFHGETAVETTPAGEDYMSRLTVAWESSSLSVEEFGVRRAVIRTAIVLSRDNIIMKLMEFTARLYFGGRLGNGCQILPWIHLVDEVNAIKFLLNNPQTNGAYNLVAPEITTNAVFLRLLAANLNRPFWFHIPAFLMRLVLGEMSVMVLEGRPASPQRIQEAGYKFKYPTLKSALQNLYNQ